MGFVANMVSLVLYFQLQMYFEVSAAANTVTNLMGSTYLLSIFGGFISDTYINRFKTCLIFGVFELAVCFFEKLLAFLIQFFIFYYLIDD